MHPKLTTISLPTYRIGQKAAELLWLKLQGEVANLDEVKICGQLYIRESCGADEASWRYSSRWGYELGPVGSQPPMFRIRAGIEASRGPAADRADERLRGTEDVRVQLFDGDREPGEE